MYKILCSTGALIGRPNNRDYRLLKDLSCQLSCDGFEFMMYDTWYDEADKLTEFLKSLNLITPVMHCEKHIGEALSQGKFNEAYEKFICNLHIAREIGASSLVIHLWDGLTSDAAFANNLKAYARLRQMADAFGIRLLVENVVCNHEDPMKHWCELYKMYPDISFVFDTKMAAFHNEMDLLYSENYAWLWKEKHICHYHVNDYAGGYKDWGNLRTLPIGKGSIDFDRFFSYIKEIGYSDTFTVEATAFDSTGAVNTDMLNGQFDIIRNGLQQG